MPPVRWKYICVSTVVLILILNITNAQLMQDAISMSADGWRPIIGTRRQPPGFPSEIKAQEITEYKNPSETVEVDIVKAETLEPPSTVPPQKLSTKVIPPDSTNNNINGGTAFKQGEKIPPHTKFTSPGPSYHTLPASVHGPPIPISGSLNKPGKFVQIKKRPANKPSTPSYFGPKRKPIRGQMVAHSTRNEVFVRPPGSFPFIKQGPSNIKTRETQGLGLLGSNHFLVNQPSHIDFSNRFAVPQNEENFQRVKNHPITYIFSKPGNDQYQFTSQNDEYTRNLVPPPPLAVFQQDTEKLKPIKLNTKVNNENVIASTEPIIKLSDFGSNIQFGRKPVEIQENLVPQLPPPFEQNFAFQKPFNNLKEQPSVDVQVTKENFKVFHSNQPINYNTNTPNVPEYIDYDFHSLKKPVQFPKLQTYEVTEGKWADNPNPFTFSITKSQPIVAQPLRQLPTARPQLVTEPIVELNVPPFLPTPYKPQGVVPTSPTQSEVSTIFSQVSTKMNRYKNEALTTNPFFFDVKEVSTHYPILGKPEPKPESPTNSPLPMDPNGEISNEITTMMNKPPQQNKSRRRRPRPRRPSTTTTTTTTTEEPLATESYNLQKIEELFEGVSVETEKPQIRRRPRPNRIRTNSIEDRPTRYRTTTPSSEGEDSIEKQVRTRNRSRHRGSGTKSENRNTPIRKRIRPTTTDMPPNHKVMEYDASLQSESTEPYIEQVQSMERETQGLFETKYPRENAQSSDTKSNRVEYELPNRHFEPTQYEDESKYETTIVSNDLNSIRKPNYEESEEEETERMQIYERTRPPISESTEQGTTANIDLPENEIDYSTSAPSTESIEEIIQTTIATTIPTTTAPETTTTKSHRIRGRPIKNRPRFSVKDYRQRLNQYTSTTPSTTTDIIKTTSEGGLRLRFPSRLRTRPTSKTTSTTENYSPDDEENTESIRRGGFKPKEPRHSTTTPESTQNNIITEKYVKSVNTRLRPFGRHRSTTEPTSAPQKVSIKPNLFSVRRRPPQFSLRTRILNKNNNTVEETTTTESETENTESVTVPTTETEFENVPTESSTMKMKVEPTTEVVESTTINLNEDDYIQRVSDLTSSFKNEYDTPGLFKSVSPNSRRIPNYFTISTDDPILPIEAFFPNIKDKEQK